MYRSTRNSSKEPAAAVPISAPAAYRTSSRARGKARSLRYQPSARSMRARKYGSRTERRAAATATALAASRLKNQMPGPWVGWVT